MLPREILEILHAVMAILVLFEHFSGNLCLNFLTPILSTSPNIDALCSHIFNYACLRHKAFIIIEKVRNYEKIAFIKNIVEKR